MKLTRRVRVVAGAVATIGGLSVVALISRRPLHMCGGPEFEPVSLWMGD